MRLKIGIALACLAGIICLCIGCETVDLNNETLLGIAIKNNAYNAKTARGAYQSGVVGDALIGVGQAKAGQGGQTVVVNNGVSGVPPAGFPHPGWPNVVADGKGGWEPAPGYKWLTQDDGDTRVIKIK